MHARGKKVSGATAYEAPTVTSLSSAELLERLGPAQGYGGSTGGGRGGGPSSLKNVTGS